MIKKTQSLSRKYKMPYIYLNDLFSLEEILKESDFKNYKIETKDFEYQNVEEIKEDGSIIHELLITANNPYVRLSFTNYSAEFYTSCDDLRTSGLFSKINNYLENKEQKILFSIIKVMPFFGPSLFALGIFKSLSLLKNKETHFSIFLFFICLIIAISYVLSFKKMIKEYSTIELSTKKNEKGYFERNKDQLINIVLGALLGGIITYLVTLFLIK